MNTNIQPITPTPLQISPTTDLSLSNVDNRTICAGNFNRTNSSLSDKTIVSDQLINDLLEGTSGRIVWGIVQLVLTLLGNIGN